NITITNADHFVNIVILLSSLLIIICGVLKLGSFIKLVPQPVISGFMDGIAIIIVVSQIEKLFGLGKIKAFEGVVYINILVAFLTLILIFIIPKLLNIISNQLPKFLPGTLASIIFMTLISNLFPLNIENINISTNLNNLNDLKSILLDQFPADWSYVIIIAALPFAFQLTMLCYLDTLLTSLVIDKMTKEKTKQNKELVAQGTANGLVAFIGGIPGAQATIRSVLLVKEGATLRLAGIAVGFLVIFEVLMLSQWMTLIPQAVFTGVLLKVAYDVFDWDPIRSWIKSLLNKQNNALINKDIFFILGTMLFTVIWNLNIAVIGFTILFHILKKINNQKA
ncbi:MAG TPA: SulP family inorganic anion transporter, partial [Alphaproteobacteria bacterium]|nr:SulP family inorganic anion transporter [Alphaproteobacteria bacterium]